MFIYSFFGSNSLRGSFQPICAWPCHVIAQPVSKLVIEICHPKTSTRLY